MLLEFHQGSAPASGFQGCILERFYQGIFFQKPLNPLFQNPPALSMNNSYRVNVCVNASFKVIDKKIRYIFGYKSMKI